MKHIITLLAVIVSFVSYGQKEIENGFGKAIMYVNKDFAPRDFQKVLVVSGIHNVDVDNKILDEFKELGIIAVSGMSLLPPVKEYTQEEIKAICSENMIDGIVTVTREGIEPGMTSNKNKMNLKLTVQDLTKDINAVTFIGSVIRFNDKANWHFVNLAMPELKTLMKKA